MTSIENSRHIVTATVSEAWCRVFLEASEATGGILGPTTVCIKVGAAGAFANDAGPVRAELDRILNKADKPVTNETAATIFPHRMWQIKGWDVDQLSDWYINTFLPRLKGSAPAQLRRSYFERMVDYFSLGQNNPSHRGNQLRFVLERCREAASGHAGHFRQSGLQIAIFDPDRDHSRQPYLSFPCLQQVGFHFPSKDSLGLTAYYPTQKLIERAFGNYLGLCQLGEFMSHSLGLKFAEFGCFIGSPRLGCSKTATERLPELAEAYLSELAPDSPSANDHS